MKIQIEKEGSRMDDYSFKKCVKYAPFKVKDVEDIIACVPGEADGPNWHYICKLNDGKFGYVTAWCDYSGWGCQEDGEGIIGTMEECLNKPEDIKVKINLANQISGTTPYGLR